VKPSRAKPSSKKPSVKAASVKKKKTEENENGPRIGARLRHARLLNQLRLKDVAEKAGCSESMLSKIENERAVPSLTTLHRLCKSLNLSVSSLFNSETVEPWTIMRPDQRRTIGHAKAAGSEGVLAEVLIPSAEGRLLEGFLVVIEPGGTPTAPSSTKAKK